MQRNLIIYVHGKGGAAEEAKHYQMLFPNSDVIGFDYHSQTPWEAKKEFLEFFEYHSNEYASITLIANSIGAFFAMNSLSKKHISKALFISPIVNMEKLITDMMMWSNVNEKELQSKKLIHTDFGETLSWDYLCYVRDNPINWHIPTYILYGGKDSLTNRVTITEFANKVGAELIIMEEGEHWFHTDEQMKFLDNWIYSIINGGDINER